MKVCAAILLAGLSLAVPSHSLAGPSFLVEFFVGGCLLPEANFEATIAYAKVAGWEDAPAEVLPMIMPADEPSKFAAWVVNEAGGPYVVAASVGNSNGEEIQSCAIMGTGTYSEIKAVILKMGGVLLDEADEVVQITSVFEIVRLGNRLLAVVVRGHGSDNGIIRSCGQSA